MLEPPEHFKEWVLAHAHDKGAKISLFALSFAEASFFPIPPDIFLIAMLLVGSRRWKYYAFLTASGSVLGAAFGYILGFLFFDTFGDFIIQTYNLQDEFASIQASFDKNTFAAIFLAGFTLIPFKVFTIAGGLFKVDFISFIVASIISRSLRFYLIAYITRRFGRKFGSIFLEYFNFFTVFVVLIVILFFFFI